MTYDEAKDKANGMLFGLAPKDWEGVADQMPEADRGELARALEGIAERATVLGTYLGERYGYGAGDQGHKSAIKVANRKGKALWMRVLGYNGYHGLSL